MGDIYDATFSAVRGMISNGNIGEAVRDVMRDSINQHMIARFQDEMLQTAFEYQRPSAVYRPSLSADGNQWLALYGANLQDGIAGFGDTAAEAMADFDKNWNEQKARLEEDS